MRVKELATQLKIPAGIVLSQARKLKLDVSTIISTFSASDLGVIQGYFNKLSPELLAKVVAVHEATKHSRSEKAEVTRKAEAEKNAEAVGANRRSALNALSNTNTEKAPEVKTVETKPVATSVEPVATPVVTPTVPVVEAKPAAAPAPQPVAPTVTKPVVQAPVKKPVNTPYVKKEDDVATPATASHLPQNKAQPPKPYGAANRPRDGRQAQQPNRNKNNRNQSNNTKQPWGKNNNKQNGRTVNTAPVTPTLGVVSGKTIQIRGLITVKEFAELMGLRPNMLIADLMRLNVLASINQRLDLDITHKIAAKYGFTIDEQQSRRSSDRKPVIKGEGADDDIPEDKPEELILRPPVVTFMGHVDHGKTTLVDYIRATRVAAGEAGGITQHIGAYTVDVQNHKITFIDTPGHAAFSAMRARGANLTDIAVIVVAADDGVMPQTREAISHARNAGVQILVAINKCDKPDARPDRVRQMLQAEGLSPEEWGGDIVCCEVSGVTGDGISNLLEMIILQAEVLELQANPTRRANGSVVESQLEQGLGPTATLLIQGGTLKIGDIILCGGYYGKVRSLINECGKQVKSASPSIAVKCTGLSGVPEAGSAFRVMLNEKRARELAETIAEENKHTSLSSAQSASMLDWASRLGSNGKAELGIVLKSDTQGTAEAVTESLKTLKSEKVTVKLIFADVGSIAPTDVQRAGSDCGSIILGFNVNCEPGVQSTARQNSVRIQTFRIIYELLAYVKNCMLDLIPPEYKEVIKGHAEIRQAFDIGKLGRIAGSQMLDGSLTKKGKFRIIRKKETIYDGALETMKHFKADVTEVTGAQECGLGFGKFENFQVGDIIECYVMEELPKTL